MVLLPQIFQSTILIIKNPIHQLIPQVIKSEDKDLDFFRFFVFLLESILPWDEFLVNDEDQADVGHHVDKIGRHAAIEAPNALQPPGVANALPQVPVDGELVLHARPQHLVGVGGHRSKQLREGGEREVLRGGLQ